MKRQRGFTLIELMVVLAIIGIMSALIVSVATTPGNPAYASADISSQLSFARHRAIATRRVHRVQFEPQVVSIWQSNAFGFKTPVGWEQVQAISMPAGVLVWNADTVVRKTATGVDPGQESGIMGVVDFRPDGSSTGGTVFVQDQNARRKFRVLTYASTGGAYLREDW